MNNKKNIFILAGFLIIYIFFEFSCFAALKILEKYKRITYSPIDTKNLPEEIEKTLIKFIDRPRYYVFDPDLGWDIKKNGYANKHIYANSQGLRANREYPFKKPENTLRILSFGDSFTECAGVSNKLTWQSFLEEYENVEALNFGVGGYGLDQAYLKYLKKGKPYEANIVLIGLLTDDVYRHVLVFWPFYGASLKFTSGTVVPKPRFKIVDDKLSFLEQPFKNLADVKGFINNPGPYLEEFGAEDYFYQHHYKKHFLDIFPSVRLGKVIICDILNVGENIIQDRSFNPESEAVQTTVKIIDNFVEEVRKEGDFPIVIVFPDEADIKDARNNLPKRYDPILKYLENKKYDHIDILDAIQEKFPQIPMNQIIAGHYSPLTNKLVAQTIMFYVRDMVSRRMSLQNQ